ncbi:MAG: hypothetical protein A2X61_09780 [Ignavibacteria bacterium GWB2_35_12]|nr:MAG: hypothetical protein A2X61_09780 [Ignavibacteria bacterium GWB2_35_12]OGU91002.1 MAG: hypothetical protein A2220_06885 [Ignavibacteria bacterium RIFOXYA2_FULL_35_10]OGV22734.1 MAG: hypothetical protein A2475_01685 [Ignavibacteria bacterium RIFOXYC2_FULL_35_21]
MLTSYTINADELPGNFVDIVKESYKGKKIEITISEYNETDYLLQSPKNREILLKSVKNINSRKNLVEVPLKQLEKAANA